MIEKIVLETTTPYRKESLKNFKRDVEGKSSYLFGSDELAHFEEFIPLKGMVLLDMVYIKVGVDLEKAERHREEIVRELAPLEKELGKGMTLVEVKKLLNMDANLAMRFMALVGGMQISDLRTPYKTHPHADTEQAKTLSERNGMLHIYGFNTTRNRIKA